MEYIKVSQAAEKWGITPRRVRVLCVEGKIEGVIRKGKLYMIPETAVKPMDGRLSKTNIIAEIEHKRECDASSHAGGVEPSSPRVYG